MKNKLYNLLKFFIGWPFTVIAFIFIAKLIAPQADTLLSMSNHMNMTLLIYGILCFVIFYFLRSYIWHRLIQGLGHEIPFKNSCYMWAISELKRYIPGSIWSFMGRTIIFSEKGVNKKDTAKSLIIEAELFIIGSAILSVLALPFIFPGFQLQFTTLSGFLVTTSLVILLTLYIFSKRILSILNFQLSTLNFIFPSYPPAENLLLILISTAALFFFGLGNYLVIGSYLPLHPQMILELTGFFVLSFLIGYLSILTPAGFGVREGMMIYGLTKITTASVAAFASIFSRITLILAEVLFIILAFLWHKGTVIARKNDEAIPSTRLPRSARNDIVKIEGWLAKHPHEMIVGFLATLYTLYFTHASFLRYDYFYTGKFDLGNMVQTVWNTMHGRIFLFTNPDSTEPISRLAFHADFILILLAPFYFLWSSPKMILLIQVIVVAAGAFFVYLISKDIIKDKNISLVLSFAYLINPSVQRANLYDFHAVVLATTFFLATYYFYLKKKYSLFIIMAILAAVCKEQLWLIIALFGGLLIIRQKKFLLGTIFSLVSIFMFYFLIWHAIPNAMGSQHFALSFYADFGDKPSDIVKAIIFSPDKVYNIVTEQSRITYLKQLFSPLGYLPLIAPFFLIFAGPDFTINLLSNNANFQQIYYQYTATITPFLFIAAIWGVWVVQRVAGSKWLVKKTTRHAPHAISLIMIIYLLTNALNAAYNFGPLPGSKRPNLDMLIKPVQEKTYVDQYLSQIPEDYIVAASNNLGSHLSHREHIYVVPLGIDQADMVVLFLTDPWSIKRDTELLAKLKQNPQYELIAEHNRFYAFKKLKLN